MNTLRRQSVIEQAAEHLRRGLREKHWEGQLPGEASLAKEIGVSKATARAAFLILEKEGLLEGSGSGRRRNILEPGVAKSGRRSLRVAFLLNQPIETESAEMQAILLNIKHAITAAGHDCFFTASNLTEMKSDAKRIARHVGSTPADALIFAGGTRHVVEWFSRQSFPALAFASRSVGVPIAAVGNDLTPAIVESIRLLAAYGHRRIVMITPEIWRKPTPGRFVTTFTEELLSRGITTGAFNVPDWHDSPDGFHELLANLFKNTPPTALLTAEPKHTLAALSFFALNEFAIWATATTRLQRFRALPGLKNIACAAAGDMTTIEALKNLLPNLGSGSDSLKLYAGSVPIEFIREGSVMLAVQTDGSFAPGVRETLMIVARELNRIG